MATIHADTSRLAFQIIACSYISKVTRVYNMGKTLPSFSLQTIQMSFATPEWPLKGRKWELSHVIFGLAYFQTNPFPGFAGFGTPTKIKHLPFFDSVVGLFILGKLNIYIYYIYIFRLSKIRGCGHQKGHLQGSKPMAAALSALASKTCWMSGPVLALAARDAASRSSIRSRCSVGRGARLNLVAASQTGILQSFKWYVYNISKLHVHIIW